MSNVKCDYCGKEAEWVDNSVIYHNSFGKSSMIWYCKPCDAYVGCHNNGKKPYGRLADKELRTLRIEAKTVFLHKMLNDTWDCSKEVKNNAYKKLTFMLNMSSDNHISFAKGKLFHFGDSTLESCKAVIKILGN